MEIFELKKNEDFSENKLENDQQKMEAIINRMESEVKQNIAMGSTMESQEQKLLNLLELAAKGLLEIGKEKGLLMESNREEEQVREKDADADAEVHYDVLEDIEPGEDGEQEGHNIKVSDFLSGEIKVQEEVIEENSQQNEE